MQERQTQVLALPARAEGSDSETEGILGKALVKGSPGSQLKSPEFPEIPSAFTQASATYIHARREMHRESNAALVFSL